MPRTHYDATYRAAHIEEIRSQKAKYRVAHPEPARERSRRRRARKNGVELNDLSLEQWEEIRKHYKNRCVYCNKKSRKLTMDHIVPLFLRGNHTASNVVPACFSCNSKKQTKPPPVPVQPLLLTLANPKSAS